MESLTNVILEKATYLSEGEKDSLIQQLPKPEARNELVMGHINMLPGIVHGSGSNNFDDKFSVALELLIEGIDRFHRQGRTGPITPYLQNWVRFELYKYLKNAYKVVKVPTGTKNKTVEVQPLSKSIEDSLVDYNDAQESIEYDELKQLLKRTHKKDYEHLTSLMNDKKVNRQTVFTMRQRFMPLATKYLRGERCVSC